MSETKIPMSVLPFLTPPDTGSASLPLFQEWACDEATWELDLTDGRMQLLSGGPALRVWAQKALRTPLARFAAYTTDYGSELEELIGQPYSEAYIRAEAQRMVSEALLASPYITEVGQVSTTLAGDGKLVVRVGYQSVYGANDVEVTV